MKVTEKMGVLLRDTTITTGDPVFLDVKKEPFDLYGTCGDGFCRVPEDVARATSADVERIGKMTPGVRVRFKTNSDYIVVHAHSSLIEPGGLLSLSVRASFDMYEYDGEKFGFLGTFGPSQGDDKDYIECRIRLDGKMHDLVLDFPICSQVTEFYIALRNGSELEHGSKYKYTTPAVFYGSSIVHGIGAGRPGMNYPAIISRIYNTDIRNFGFGGAAKGEPAIIDYMAGLDMSVFVYDYDHNAPSADFLRDTHYAGYKRFRTKRPDVPIVLASKVDYYSSPEANEVRRRIIIDTFNRAKSEGDKLIEFVDGREIYDKDYRAELTIDNCHPNDGGYVAMAKAFGKVIEKYICIK